MRAGRTAAPRAARDPAHVVGIGAERDHRFGARAVLHVHQDDVRPACLQLSRPLRRARRGIPPGRSRASRRWFRSAIPPNPASRRPAICPCPRPFPRRSGAASDQGHDLDGDPRQPLLERRFQPGRIGATAGRPGRQASTSRCRPPRSSSSLLLGTAVVDALQLAVAEQQIARNRAGIRRRAAQRRCRQRTRPLRASRDPTSSCLASREVGVRRLLRRDPGLRPSTRLVPRDQPRRANHNQRCRPR